MKAAKRVTKKKKIEPVRPKRVAQPHDPEVSPLVREVDGLAELLQRRDLSELEIELQGPSGVRRIHLRRGGSQPMVAAAPLPPAVFAAAAPPPASVKEEPADGNTSYITSPFVGTFYRSPNPESPAFVEIGVRVRKGQVLCIVEAMKLMNEIEAEVDGVIVQALVENGHPVEYGEPLFKIRQE